MGNHLLLSAFQKTLKYTIDMNESRNGAPFLLSPRNFGATLWLCKVLNMIINPGLPSFSVYSYVCILESLEL